MDISHSQDDDFLKFFKQTKQRVDIDIDLENSKITGLAKLSFVSKENNIQEEFERKYKKYNCSKDYLRTTINVLRLFRKVFTIRTARLYARLWALPRQETLSDTLNSAALLPCLLILSKKRPVIRPEASNFRLCRDAVRTSLL